MRILSTLISAAVATAALCPVLAQAEFGSSSLDQAPSQAADKLDKASPGKGAPAPQTSTDASIRLQPADQAMFGSWRVQKDGPALEMYSANENGATLGVMCVTGQTCAVYVATRSQCTEGSQYTGVVGADSGFADFSLTCRVVKDRFVYVLSDFPRAIKGLRDSSKWGLAVLGVKGNNAQSYRFTVAGTQEAVGAMARLDQATGGGAKQETIY